MKPNPKRMTNAGDFSPGPDYRCQDPEKEKLLLKLGTMITDRYLIKYTHTMKPSDPEVWALDMVLTKEEVRFLLSFRRPRTFFRIGEIARRNGMSVAAAQMMTDHLMWIGVLECNRENPEHELQYNVPIFVPGIAEFMMMNDHLTDAHPELATFFNLMTQLPLEGITQMVPPGGGGVGMHVIPVEKAIEAESRSVSVEHISHWLKKYDKYSVGICSCRKQQTMRGEGTGDICGEYCIGVGDMAEYNVLRHTGRYITYEEAMEIIERSERHGYVHQITNIDGEDKIVAICNCAPGVCNGIRTSQLYNTPNMSRSAYRAHVDADRCAACGKCAEVCPVGAAKLGQRLCTAAGRMRYPQSELPDSSRWSSAKWNPGYREDAKISCYDSGTAPCKASCPAHIAVQGYIRMAREGRYMDALKLIKQDNPLPAVCGAVCNRRCEDACMRGTLDSPVAIDEIKKFIAARELDEENRYVPLCENGEGGFWDGIPIAVIGAGPAGLSAAYYLRRSGYPVTVFEKNGKAGGMLRYGIPEFRLEKDILDAEIAVLEKMGVIFCFRTEIGRDLTLAQLRKQGYRAFYLAIGAQGGRRSGIPGEEGPGAESGVEFLRRINESGPEELAGDTVVIGGGNVAVDTARTAVRITAGKVMMFSLEQREEMPAAADEIREAEEEGIEIRCGWGPAAVERKDGHVCSVVMKKCISVKDASGRFAPQYDDSCTFAVPCSHVIFSIGQTVEWGGLLEGENVICRPDGTVKADVVTLQTSCPDIFAGGDVVTGPRFAIDAIAAGHAAEDSINRFVHPGQSLTIGRDLRRFPELNKEEAVVESYDTAPRQVPGRKPGNPKATFSDLRDTMTEEQIRAEAARCLGCGAAAVDLNRCIGCGLCTTRCEFDAIHLRRDLPEASDMVRCEDKIPPVASYAARRAMRILFRKKDSDA